MKTPHIFTFCSVFGLASPLWPSSEVMVEREESAQRQIMAFPEVLMPFAQDQRFLQLWHNDSRFKAVLKGFVGIQEEFADNADFREALLTGSFDEEDWYEFVMSRF